MFTTVYPVTGLMEAAARRLLWRDFPDLRSKRIASLTDEQLYDTIAYGNGHQAYAHSFQQFQVADPDYGRSLRYIQDCKRIASRRQTEKQFQTAKRSSHHCSA